MADIFDFENYRAFLKEVIADRPGARGFQKQLAEAAGCQPSYFSQVLAEKVELTPDHAAKMAQFLGLSDKESELFLNLVMRSRASDTVLKMMLEKRILELKVDHSQLSNRLSSINKSAERSGFYYSSWIFLAVHYAIGIESLQTEEKLAQRLNVDRAEIARALNLLESEKLAKLENGRWTPLERDQHLPASSTLSEINHMNWRIQALRAVQRHRPTDVHYTSVFTIGKNEANMLRNLILKTIDESRSMIRSSGEEEVCALTIDFFPL
jgi:uncharacterized protein (TIGR02147 family)